MRWTYAALAVFLGSLAALAADGMTASPEEAILRAAKIGTDDATLLDHLRKRTGPKADAQKIKEYVRQLGDESFDTREAASAALLKLDSTARSFLEPAVRDRDVEIARRAKDLLARIGGSSSPAVDGAVVRLVGRRKPAPAVEVLLAYLPAAPTPAVADEVRDTLVALAMRDKEPDPVLLAGLKDADPIKRAAAGAAFVRAGMMASVPGVLELLKDDSADVRLALSLALASVGDKAGVPALIALLGDLPRPLAWQAEDVLLRLSEGKGPAVSVGNDRAARVKCRDAWAAWWTKNGERAKFPPTAKPLGHTLVILLSPQPEVRVGTLREVDAKGKTLWQVKDVGFPLDAQLLPGDRILCAEHGNNRVAERDRAGRVVWEHKVQEGPLVAQRLANGNTFIVTERRILEVDKTGKEVFTYTGSGKNGDEDEDATLFRKAAKLPNGDIVYVNGSQEFVRLGPDRKEIQRFTIDVPTGGVRTNGGRIDVLPNGNVLLPFMNDNKIVEFDSEGQKVWEATVEQPVNAVRLPDGHTLATTFTQPRAIELDRFGREVWDYKGETRVTRAWRR